MQRNLMQKRLFVLALLVMMLITGGSSAGANSSSPDAVLAWNSIAQRTAIEVGKLSPAHSFVALSDVQSPSASIPPDAATEWNAIAVQALATAAPPRPVPVAILDMAVVQLAVHDAVQAIEGRFEPYHVEIPGASGSPAAATAKAAHDVLVNILPGQTASLDTIYHDYLAAHSLAEDDPGVGVGEQAAAGILALRADDGRMAVPPPPAFIGGTDPGEWRPTPSYQPGLPPSFAPMAVPWLGTVPPFALKSGDQYRPTAPPPLKSKRYAKEYNEVKDLGARFNSARSPEQTQLANFYTGNLFVLNNQILRDVAAEQTHNIGDNARLLALGTMAMADAIITAWDSKSHYVLWRPVTAIQEGDNDGNERTAGDATWEPFINTPNYPDYTSGLNNVSGALTRTFQLFFGTDHVTFTVHSQQPPVDPANTRTYQRFSDLAQDIVDVRIYQGIHFRSADEEARKQGRKVAQWVFGHFLRPIDSE